MENNHSSQILPRKLSIEAIIIILLTNSVPIIGVFLFNWSALAIITMYWLESIVIGGFNIIKIIINQGGPDPDLKIGDKPANEITGIKFIIVPFFMVHYGIFMGVQGVFMGVYEQLGKWANNFPSHLWWGLGAILLNQTVGLLYGHLYKGEYRRVKLGVLFFQPYPRVFIQQLVAIIGSFFMTFLNAQIGALIVFIVVKTCADFIGNVLIAEKKAVIDNPK